MNHSDYVEHRNGGYDVSGVRVSLDSIVCSFNQGQSPDAIQENFPLLKLSQIYGAITFYLDHKAEIDQYIEDSKREFEMSEVHLSQENTVLRERLQRARVRPGELQN